MTTTADALDISGPILDGDHWRRLIAAANTAMADAAIESCQGLIDVLFGWLPSDSAAAANTNPVREATWQHAATLAHMVHPLTIAADTGNPTELDYYREDRPCVILPAL